MSLYAEFVQEIMNWQTLEEEDAFVSYEIQNVRSIKCLKVIEMYVRPHARGKQKWLNLMNQVEKIARENKCTSISATISKSTSEFVQQRTAFLCDCYDMKKTYEDVYSIIYSKGLNYE